MRPQPPLTLFILIFLVMGTTPVIMGDPIRNIPDKRPEFDHREMIDLDLPQHRVHVERIEGRTWSKLEMEGAIFPPTEGGPSLPFLTRSIRSKRDIEDIDIQRSDPETYRVDHHIPPSPEPMSLTREVLESGATSPLVIDRSLYLSGDVFPEEPLKWAFNGYGWETGERLAHYSVSVCPFDYDPSSGTLIRYGEISLLVKEEEGHTDDDTLMITRDVERPSRVEEGTELLIISHDPFENDLDNYVQWKREKGLIVSMVGYSHISSYGGKSGHQAMWQFIHDTYFGDGKNLKWVLLAGEPKFVPTLMAHDQDPYGNEPSRLPADTYFACLDGGSENWNSDGDSRWAETGDILDAVPEVYVTRVSLDTDSEASNWANKVVQYETEPDMGGYSSKVGLFGSTTHEYDDGPKQCEYLYSSYLNDVFNTPSKYYSYGSVQNSVGAQRLTRSNARGAVNSGLSAIFYMGHGYHQMWSEGTQNNPSPLFYSSDAASFSQSPMLPMISAMSCETNWFDNGNWESISEAFIENPNGGAIGYIGASRTTEGGIGYYEYLPGAPGIQEDVARMMKNGRTHQGEIFHEAKSHYYDQWSPWFGSYQFAYNAWVEHNMLGSPETEIWTNSISTFQVDVEFDSDYYSNFTIDVSDGFGDPVQGAMVTVYSDKLGLSSRGETASNGEVEVPFKISEPAYAKVTVTRRNFKPYQKSYYIEDQTDPETFIDYDLDVPDGSGSWYRSDPGIGFHSSEPGQVRYRWNGGSHTSYRGGTIAIPKGDNLLEYWTEDLAGNDGDIEAVSVKYDPDVPELDYLIEPDEPDGSNDWYNTLPRITTSIEGDEASPHYVEYWWGRDEKHVSNGTIFALQGDNELHIQAVDEAGNSGDEITIALMVDSIAPRTDHNTGGEEPNDHGWYTNTMTIELNCDDRTAETFFRWGENGEWKLYRDEIQPPQGNNTLQYRSVDPRGNEEPVRSLQVPYDTRIPKISTEIRPASPDGQMGWYVTAPTLELSTEEDWKGDSIYYFVDNGLEQPYTDTIHISEGEHTVFAYGIDRAGNRGPTQSFSFKVDTDEPSTDLFMDASPDEEGWITEVPMITLRCDDDDATTFFSWTGNGDFQVYDGSILPPEEEGELMLFYYSMDEAGNKEETMSHPLYLDAVPPMAVAITPPSADSGEEVTFDLSRSTDGSGIEAYYIDFGDGTNSGWISSPTVTHVYTSGGTYQVEIRTRDVAGHESEPEIVTISVSEEQDDTMLYLLIGGLVLLFVVLIMISVALIVSKKRQYDRHHPHHPHPAHPAQARHPVGNRPPHHGGNVAHVSSGRGPHQAQHGLASAPSSDIKATARSTSSGTSVPGLPASGTGQPVKNDTTGKAATNAPPPPRMPDVPGPPKPPV